MTDGTAEYNEKNYRNSLFYDLAKSSVIRIAWAQAKELALHGGTALALPRVRRTTDEWKKRASLILFRQETPRKRCYPRADLPDLLAYLRSLPPGGNSASGTSHYLPHLAAPGGTDD